jgi:hypothetical protein
MNGRTPGSRNSRQTPSGRKAAAAIAVMTDCHPAVLGLKSQSTSESRRGFVLEPDTDPVFSPVQQQQGRGGVGLVIENREVLKFLYDLAQSLLSGGGFFELLQRVKRDFKQQGGFVSVPPADLVRFQRTLSFFATYHLLNQQEELMSSDKVGGRIDDDLSFPFLSSCLLLPSFPPLCSLLPSYNPKSCPLPPSYLLPKPDALFPTSH